MQQTLPFSKNSRLFLDESDELRNQSWLDRLGEGKLSWDRFLQKTAPLSVSRLNTTKTGRNLLHLAILDDRLDVVQMLREEGSLKLRQDAYGLTALELGQFLDRKECLRILQPLSERPSFPSLPKLEEFEYLPYPIFETKEILERVLAAAGKAKRDDKVSSEKIWMGIYFDKEIRKGSHPPVSIRLVDEEVGYGVYADKKIPACTYVGEYTGVIQERNPKLLKDKLYCLRYTVWDGKKNLCVDAEKKGNFTRFFNHSSKPNLCLQSIYWRGIPRMVFVALREIREGGQLTFDYGPLFWKGTKQSQKFLDDF